MLQIVQSNQLYYSSTFQFCPDSNLNLHQICSVHKIQYVIGFRCLDNSSIGLHLVEICQTCLDVTFKLLLKSDKANKSNVKYIFDTMLSEN